MMKVHIIGLPSAGKTTLARGLSPHLGVPHHDLDAVAFLDERWTLRPAADRDELVAQIAASPGFVTEGGFLRWVTPLFAAADRILWLDPPLWVLIWRHVRRHGRLFQPQWLIARLRFQVLCYVRPVGKGPAKFGRIRRVPVSKWRYDRGLAGPETSPSGDRRGGDYEARLPEGGL